MEEAIPAYVQCTNCCLEVEARIVLSPEEGLKKIEPPRQWFYVWREFDTLEENSKFACSRWCARDIMAEIAEKENIRVFSWCVQTQMEETFIIE